MKAKGLIRITEELEITNPELTIENVLIEAIFTDEKGNKHSRFIQLDSDVSNLSNIRIDDDIKNNEILKQFS